MESSFNCLQNKNSSVMKQLLFIALSLIFFSSANAQSQYPLVIIKSSKGPNFEKLKPSAFNDPNSKYLFDNNKGKVFQSLVDNMRFLAPNYRSNMPYPFVNSNSYMPVLKMVPKTQKPETNFLPKVPPSK